MRSVPTVASSILLGRWESERLGRGQVGGGGIKRKNIFKYPSVWSCVYFQCAKGLYFMLVI